MTEPGLIQPVKRLRLTRLVGDDLAGHPDVLVCDGVPGCGRGGTAAAGTSVLVHTDLPAPPNLFDDESLTGLVMSAVVTLWNVPGPLVRWVEQRPGSKFLLDVWHPVADMAGHWTGWIFAPHQLVHQAGVDVGCVVGSLACDVLGRFYTFRASTAEMPAPTV